MNLSKKTLNVSILVLSFALANISHAQDANPNADISAEAARNTALAGLITSETELRNARIAAQLGTTIGTGLEGTITADAAARTLFAQYLIYNSVDEAAGEIVDILCEIKDIDEKKILIGDVSSYNVLQNSKALAEYEIQALDDRRKILVANIEAITEAVDKLKNQQEDGSPNDGSQDFIANSVPIGAVLQSLPLIAGQAESVSKFFRTNTTLSAVNVTLNRNVFQRALIAKHLTKKSCGTLSVPSNTLVDVTNRRKDPFLIDVNNLRNNTTQLQIDLIKANANLDYLSEQSNDDDKKIIIENFRKQLNDAAALLVTNHSTFYNTLTQATSTTAAPINSYYILNQISNADYYLNFTIENTSALSITSQKFLKSQRLNYAGAVAVSYDLVDKEGNFTKAGLKTSSTCHRAKRSSAFIFDTNSVSEPCSKNYTSPTSTSATPVREDDNL